MSKKDKSELISFDEYLQWVKVDPSIVKNAHARIYEAIMKKGFTVIGGENDERDVRALGLGKNEKITKYGVFSDFYGIEKAVEKIVAYFRAAKSGGEASKKFLFLYGPPSTGKSSLVRAIFSALQDEEIYYIEGCPIREEPLNLIPRNARGKMEAELKVKIPHNGDLCHACREKVKEEFKGDYKKFQVRKYHISVRASRFFASIDPTDPMSFDKAKFIGGVTLGEKEGDPSAYEMDGAFHRANRGLLEIVEIFKNTPEVLYLLLEATQSKTIESPAGRTGKIFIDVAIIAHSNEAEWEKFISEKRNEALLDRLIMIKIPLNVRLDEQIRIYEKICGRNGYHVAPFALKALAAFTVLTRIKSSAKVKNLIDKMRVYNGEYVGTDLPDVKELKNENPDDGMFGLSNRDGAQIFELAFANQPPVGHLCVDANKIFKIADEFVREIPDLDDEEKNRYLQILEGVKKWCAGETVAQFASFSDCFPEVCDEVFREYLEASRKKAKDGELTPRELALLDEIRINDMSLSEETDLRNILIEKFKKAPISEITFLRAPEVLKPLIRRLVVKETIIKIIQTVAIEKESMILNEAALKKKETVFKKAKELGYCEICFKSVASWLIVNDYL